MIKDLFLHFIEDIIRNISGSLGIRLRRAYYKRRLGSAGNKLTIETGVFFQSPKDIFLGDTVWVDKNCILIAGLVSFRESDYKQDRSSFKNVQQGKIKLGSFSHMGIGTIIQGHGGVSIGDFFTSSAGCRLYSLSNDYQECRSGTVENTESKPGYYVGFISAGRNVWLGLGVSLISTSLGDDVFILPHSVVYKSIESNSVAGGNPAVKIKSRFKE